MRKFFSLLIPLWLIRIFYFFKCRYVFLQKWRKLFIKWIWSSFYKNVWTTMILMKIAFSTVILFNPAAVQHFPRVAEFCRWHARELSSLQNIWIFSHPSKTSLSHCWGYWWKVSKIKSALYKLIYIKN